MTDQSKSPNGSHNAEKSNHANWLDDFRIATVFLTRIPLNLVHQPDGIAVTRSMRAFPLVGLGLGLAMAILFAVLTGVGCSHLVAAFLTVVCGTVLTGALHEDALADVADGFGGGTTVDRKLEIMSDSRIGAYGVVALVLGLGLKVALIAQLGETGLAVAGLVAGATLSRAAMVATRALLPPAKSDGLSGSGGQPDNTTVFQALGVAALVAMLTLPVSPALGTMLGAAVATVAFSGVASQQIGGQTGDVLGATQQISELAVLATIVMMTS